MYLGTFGTAQGGGEGGPMPIFFQFPISTGSVQSDKTDPPLCQIMLLATLTDNDKRRVVLRLSPLCMFHTFLSIFQSKSNLYFSRNPIPEVTLNLVVCFVHFTLWCYGIVIDSYYFTRILLAIKHYYHVISNVKGLQCTMTKEITIIKIRS